MRCFLAGIRGAGRSNHNWGRVRTGVSPVQMLRKARRVPRAPSLVWLPGEEDTGRMSAVQRGPCPRGRPAGLQGRGEGAAERLFAGKGRCGTGRGAPCAWAAGGAAVGPAV